MLVLWALKYIYVRTNKVPKYIFCLKFFFSNYIYCDGVLIILKTVITDDFINVYCYSNGYVYCKYKIFVQYNLNTFGFNIVCAEVEITYTHVVHPLEYS